MEIGKWNYKTKKYDPYTPPAGARMMAELDEVIKCAECGGKVIYGNCYTSRTIHNRYGLGYAVCSNCYTQERNQELKEEKKL